MRLNKHLLLWSSVGALAVLVWAAFSENVLADWRVAQREARRSLPPDFKVQLRQIVVPELKVVDRCVSCHVGMAPGETGVAGHPVFGAHPPVHHDPAEMGCTICHGGQGRATTKADAHGNVPHWPEPMIPRRYAYASCGSCHTHLEVPNRDLMNRGKALTERNDCFACHRIDGKGGTFRPGGSGGGEGPDLSTAGTKGYREDWYAHHLEERRRQAKSGRTPRSLPWMATFGEVPEKDRAAIETYLRSRTGAPGLLEAKALFHSLGCRGCHKVHGVGGDDGPDLSRAGQRDPALTDFSRLEGEHTLTNWLIEHFRAPAKVVPGSKMPALGLTEKEIDRLVLYTFSLRTADAPEAYWPRDRMRALRLDQREFATDGATLYGTFCAACHGPKGEGMRYAGVPPFPAIANPDFLAVAPDEFILAAVTHGRPGRRMPAWGEGEGGLRPEEIRKVVLHLRRMAGGVQAKPDSRPPRWAKGNATVGHAIYVSVCASCHGRDGRGLEGTSLRTRVFLKSATDTYLYQTIGRGRRGTTMGGFETGTPIRRALSPEEIESVVTYLRTWEDQP